MQKYKIIVIGVSAGGLDALNKLFSNLPANFPFPVIVVQHLHHSQKGFYLEYFNQRCALCVKEAEEKEKYQPGYIYFAPPNYHLLIEEDLTFSLSVDEKVNYSRPSIDVLFESAADVYTSELIGIILTGANNDGSNGMCLIKENGGLTIAQNPADAEHSFMPKSAIDAVEIDHIFTLKQITNFLIKF